MVRSGCNNERQLTNFLPLIHCQPSDSQTSYSTYGTVLHCLVIFRLRRRWLRWGRALLVATLRLTIAATEIAWLLIVTSTAITALLRRIASVVALGRVALVGGLECAFASLRVNEDIALVALVPFRTPWRGKRRVLGLLGLLWGVVGHLDRGVGVLCQGEE
jgi:hypothetical protein